MLYNIPNIHLYLLSSCLYIYQTLNYDISSINYFKLVSCEYNRFKIIIIN